MAETHISEWAKQNGVFMDRAYATEGREGGTMALDQNIPGVARKALNVLSDEEWQNRKAKLMLETWWSQARTFSQ